MIASSTLHREPGCSSANGLHEWTDEQLMSGYRVTGNESLFSELVGRYERELYHYLQRFLGNTAMAEDAFQATFLQIHLKCDRFDSQRRFRPWLYTVATNQAIDLQRRNRRHRLTSLDRRPGTSHESIGVLGDLLAEDQELPSDRFDRQERSDWIRTAVASLPDSLRTAVQLVYFRGMKYREAAEVLAVPVGTIKSRLHAAVIQLREAWAESCFAAA
ncbi:MAG: sigma-70 family RNA polymerase sigma factor [Pirellulales bacterium]|nr:sigma-70 family RNA polymerase sigma factor [Pirellulales bacterium]